ncbi:hypothetical protein AAC387_Pa04g2668 [Persea americana]
MVVDGFSTTVGIAICRRRQCRGNDGVDREFLEEVEGFEAYVHDTISSSDYEPECLKLIAQFKTLASSLGNTVASLEQFADTYKMDCPAALNRLLVAGVPATVEHRASFSGCASSAAATVAELAKMGAADELTEQQARQLHFDLESAYNAFMAALPNSGG